jgi:adenylate cyclase
MTPTEVERRLTAILHADVVGYSRLMEADEAGTVDTLTAYRRIFSDTIVRHRGRVVNAPGDALLADFGSVVDAVNCAAEVQRELAESIKGVTPFMMLAMYGALQPAGFLLISV